MTPLPFETVDVFTEQRFGGNPLAVVMQGEKLSEQTMQAVAAEFNLSETTFVLPPVDPENSARVRIFNRTEEMAFAGHPMVGTAFVLAGVDPSLQEARFEVEAGIVRVEIDRAMDGTVIGALVHAPQPLSMGENIPVEVIAEALQINSSDVVTETHPPIVASMGNPYVIAQLCDAALARCEPDIGGFRTALACRPHFGKRFSIHVYCRKDYNIRARMFAPLAGTWEDPATGSANAPLAALLLSLNGEGHDEAAFEIHQGVEMGRPSLLHVTARRTERGIVASLRGQCVAIMSGQINCG